MALFFYDALGGDTVGVAWRPHAFAPLSQRSGLNVALLNCAQASFALEGEGAHGDGDGDEGEGDLAVADREGPLLVRNAFTLLDEIRSVGTGLVLACSVGGNSRAHVAAGSGRAGAAADQEKSLGAACANLKRCL